MTRAYNFTPEGRARRVAVIQAIWDDADARQRQTERIKEGVSAEGRARAKQERMNKMEAGRANRNGWANPEVRRKRIDGIKANWAENRDERLAAIAAGWVAKLSAPDVPSWVPLSLAGEYIERALQYDEFDAAKHVRSLLREAK